MFGRKSRKIKELGMIAEGQKILAGAMEKMRDTARQEAGELREKVVGLTADRDGARDSVAALAAERDKYRQAYDELKDSLRGSRELEKPQSNSPLES